MPEIKYEITEHLGVISETARGWTREVNMISWNGREPKLMFAIGHLTTQK